MVDSVFKIIRQRISIGNFYLIFVNNVCIYEGVGHILPKLRKIFSNAN